MVDFEIHFLDWLDLRELSLARRRESLAVVRPGCLLTPGKRILTLTRPDDLRLGLSFARKRTPLAVSVLGVFFTRANNS